MTRGHGWRFLDIGRRLERALRDRAWCAARSSAGPSQVAMLEPLLEIADSAMTYRRRYFAEPQLAPVLDLLLADDTNPRPLAFQLEALAAHARATAARSARAVADARGADRRSRDRRRCAPRTSTRSASRAPTGRSTS